MENKMSEVAKLLGVELNRDFNLKDSSFTYRLTERGLDSRYKNNLKWYPSGMLEDLLIGNYQIILKPRSILDPAEKEYLSRLIKPFKDQVIAIAKRSANYGEFIDIMIDEGELEDCDNIYLPYFKPDSMYKGMKVGREYTLDQLGL